jgi:hypothetical protein
MEKYGLTREAYLHMLERQKGVCAICGCPPSKHSKKTNKEKTYYLDVDHDHTTEEVRGLLCGNCNRGLGSFKDSINNLLAAVDYLSQHGPK